MPDTAVAEKPEVKPEVKPAVETGIKPAAAAVTSDKDILKKAVSDGAKPAEAKPEPVVAEPVKVEPAAAVVDEKEEKEKTRKRIQKILDKNKAAAAAPVKAETVDTGIDGLNIKDGKIDVKDVQEYIKREVASAKSTVLSEVNQADLNERAQADRLEANKLVYEKHPEILDLDEGKKKVEEIPFAVALNEAYSELRESIPGFNNIPKAPKIAMELAEKRFGESESTRKARLDGAAQENKRQASVQASGVVSSAGGSGAPLPVTTVTLSNEEQDVARRMGLSDSDYGKYKKRAPILDPNYYAKFRTNRPRG